MIHSSKGILSIELKYSNHLLHGRRFCAVLAPAKGVDEGRNEAPREQPQLPPWRLSICPQANTSIDCFRRLPKDQ